MAVVTGLTLAGAGLVSPEDRTAGNTLMLEEGFRPSPGRVVSQAAEPGRVVEQARGDTLW